MEKFYNSEGNIFVVQWKYSNQQFLHDQLTGAFQLNMPNARKKKKEKICGSFSYSKEYNKCINGADVCD